eukprot:m.249211 g.249211  ORF g.249211 m.249211 type:complete len:92 (-) comp16140_c1_seq10:803-1078(-)
MVLRQLLTTYTDTLDKTSWTAFATCGYLGTNTELSGRKIRVEGAIGVRLHSINCYSLRLVLIAHKIPHQRTEQEKTSPKQMLFQKLAQTLL